MKKLLVFLMLFSVTAVFAMDKKNPPPADKKPPMKKEMMEKKEPVELTGVLESKEDSVTLTVGEDILIIFPGLEKDGELLLGTFDDVTVWGYDKPAHPINPEVKPKEGEKFFWVEKFKIADDIIMVKLPKEMEDKMKEKKPKEGPKPPADGKNPPPKKS